MKTVPDVKICFAVSHVVIHEKLLIIPLGPPPVQSRPEQL